MAINQNIEDLLLDYGTRTLKVKVSSPGYVDSDFSNEVDYTSAPRIEITEDTLNVYNTREAIEFIDLYGDALRLSSITFDPLVKPFAIDLNQFALADGTHDIKVKARGTVIGEVESNTVGYSVGVTPIYGVSGLFSATVPLARTDDAVGKTFAINSSSGAITSDFNTLFPWNEATVEVINGNSFLKMPEMWFRIGKDASNRITDVAVTKMQRPGDEWYKVDSFYYGIYGASGDTSTGLKSISGTSRRASYTRAQFRQAASLLGAGYFQRDIYHSTVMLFLWLIEWATKDSASIMTGKTSATGSSPVNTGGTDAVTTPSGFNTSTKQMRYHHIEDFVGNFLEFVDGSVGSGSQGGNLYVTADPSKFTDTPTGLNTLAYKSPASGDCLSALGWDNNNPFLSLPKEAVSNGSYNTYFCDYGMGVYYPVLCCGAYWSNSGASDGVSCFFGNFISYTNTSIGGRLLYKP